MCEFGIADSSEYVAYVVLKVWRQLAIDHVCTLGNPCLRVRRGACLQRMLLWPEDTVPKPPDFFIWVDSSTGA